MVWKRLAETFNRQFLTPERLVVHLWSLVQVVLILVIGVLVYKGVSFALRRLMLRARRMSSEQAQRVRTLTPLMTSITKYALAFVVLVMVLRSLGVDYSAILAGAGVIGLAVGFGAQSLVKDVIGGFFILFEGLVNVGDVIAVGDESGVVERIGLRTTQFREYSGILRTIPNGELTRFGNYNRDWMRALVSVDVAYEEDAEKGMAQALKTAQKWAAGNKKIVIEPPFVQGIVNFGRAGATIRVVVKVRPQTQWNAEFELRRLLKQALDRRRIAIQTPRQTVRVRR